jgi:hypothetical protein
MRSLSLAVLAVSLTAAAASAQKTHAQPFEIADNSLLIEEAFNQEAGIFQNILLFRVPRGGGGWDLEFTQEWPLRGQRHQLSYTLPFSFEGGKLGDVVLNYRLQARMEDDAGPAFSPRLSAILPTGSASPLRWGMQMNLPVSKQFNDVYVHANAGTTVEATRHTSGENITLISPQFGGSAIWRALPLFHLMVESVASFAASPVQLCCKTQHTSSVLISPGFRAARNFGTHQVVAAAAVPITISGPDDEAKLLLYLSYELPFSKEPKS